MCGKIYIYYLLTVVGEIEMVQACEAHAWVSDLSYQLAILGGYYSGIGRQEVKIKITLRYHYILTIMDIYGYIHNGIYANIYIYIS